MDSYEYAVWLAGIVLAVVWIVAFAVCANDTELVVSRRVWARWAGIPMLGVLFVAVVASSLPGDLRFSASQSQLDSAATAARDGRAPSAGWLGLMPISHIHAYPDGVVTFEVDHSGCGFVDVPNGWSAKGYDEWGWPDRQLTDTWWTWCGSGSYD